jgi:hypothetical protein
MCCFRGRGKRGELMLSNETIARISWGATGTLLEHWGHYFGRWEDLIPVARDALTGMAQRVRLGCGLEDSHRHWCEIMTDAGWSYAEGRDEETRCHPWICEWHRLDEGSRLFFKMHQHLVVFLVLEYPEGSDFALGLTPRRLPAT